MRTENVMKIVRAIDGIRETAKGYDTKKEGTIHMYLREIERVLESE